MEKLIGDLTITCGACKREKTLKTIFEKGETIKLINYKCQCGAEIKTNAERPKLPEKEARFKIKPIKRGSE